jgi:hypothetical protein
VTITGANIKDGPVKVTDLGSSSVTSAKVKNGTLLRKDFKAGQLLGATNPVLLAQSGVSSFTHDGTGSYTIV